METNRHINSPSKPSSESIIQGRLPVAYYLNKKRKLPNETSEQLGLPPLKHKCSLSITSDECESVFRKSVGSENGSIITSNVNAVLDAMDDLPEVQSAADSNGSYSSPAIVLYPEYNQANLDEEGSTGWSFIGRDKGDSTSSMTSRILLEDVAEREEPLYLSGECASFDQNAAALYENDYLMEYFPAYGMYSKYVKLEADDAGEQQSDDELENFMYSNGMKPDPSTLPSGSCSVNQEDNLATRGPTIDQEFEQYFSTLML